MVYRKSGSMASTYRRIAIASSYRRAINCAIAELACTSSEADRSQRRLEKFAAPSPTSRGAAGRAGVVRVHMREVRVELDGAVERLLRVLPVALSRVRQAHRGVRLREQRIELDRLDRRGPHAPQPLLRGKSWNLPRHGRIGVGESRVRRSKRRILRNDLLEQRGGLCDASVPRRATSARARR